VTAAAAPTVRAGAGVVRGACWGSSAVFLGVPDAQASVGPRRFAAPAGERGTVVDRPGGGAEPLAADRLLAAATDRRQDGVGLERSA
jgi:hypothetical protein